MALPKSGGDGPHHFEKWWGRVPTVPTVRYAYAHLNVETVVPLIRETQRLLIEQFTSLRRRSEVDCVTR